MLSLLSHVKISADTKVCSVMGMEEGCGQDSLFDYELFTEMDAVELSNSMRKYL